MDWSVLSDWLTILFFLWFGLKHFVPALDKGIMQTVGAVLALAAGLVILLDSI